MVLKDVLQQHNIPLPDDYDERFDVLISGLKKDKDFESKLAKFKSQAGGQEGMPKETKEREDFLGPKLRWFVDAMGSPYAQTIIRTLFMVIFFLSYLESIPVFGSILSAVLDLMTMGGKAMTKTIQKIIPPTLALIPLPYMNFVGMGVAAVFGMFVWPIVSLVSFSRQDFTAAIDSYVRIIPPPFGDMIADNFLEVNRTVARIDTKRQKLAADISSALSSIASATKSVSSNVADGATKLAQKTQDAAIDTAAKMSAASAKATEVAKEGIRMPDFKKPDFSSLKPQGMNLPEVKKPDFVSFEKSVPASQVLKDIPKLNQLEERVAPKEKIAFEPTPVRRGGKKLSRKVRMKNKWKTRRNRFVKH